MRYRLGLLYAFLFVVATALARPLEIDGLPATTDLAIRQPLGSYQEVTMQLLIFGLAANYVRFTWDCIRATFVLQSSAAGNANYLNREHNGVGGVTYQLTFHAEGEGEIARGQFGSPQPYHYVLEGQSTQLLLSAATQDDNSMVLAPGRWDPPNVIYPGRHLTATDLITGARREVEFRELTVGQPFNADPIVPPPAPGDGWTSESDSSSEFGGDELRKLGRGLILGDR